MRRKFKKKIRPFDATKPLSESTSYDEDLDKIASKRWPLSEKSKPKRRGRFIGEETTDLKAKDLPWKSWVWHPEARVGNEKEKGFVGPPKGDWLKHGASRYPGKNKHGKRGQITKHPGHDTYWKTVIGETLAGNYIYLDKKDKVEYSKPAWWLGGKRKAQ